MSYQFKYIKKTVTPVCTDCGEEKKIYYKSGKLLERITLCYDCNRKRKNRKATGEKQLFMRIWKEREHVSFLTGKPLKDPFGNLITEKSSFWVNCFAHVLAKGKYKDLRLNEDNIILLTPAEHFMLDMGTYEQRQKYAEATGCSWQTIYALKESILEEYNQNK